MVTILVIMRQVARMLLTRFTINTGFASTHSVEGPEGISEGADVDIRIAERCRGGFKCFRCRQAGLIQRNCTKIVTSNI